MDEETDILEERRTANGRNRWNLTTRERKDLAKQESIEAAVALLLDLGEHRTTQQIADELGITRKMLKDMYRREDFQVIWSEHFVELGHDPRLMRVREAITDLLPLAYQQLEKMLTSGSTKDGTKAKLIKQVFDLSGIKPIKPQGSDRRELAEFLGETERKGGTVNLTQINVKMAPEYDEALQRTLAGEIQDAETVDGEIVENPGEVKTG